MIQSFRVFKLDEEGKRFVREGFESDEELAMFDLLCKETLTPQEIKKVKALSKTLLETVKAKIAELDHWTEKPETLDIVEIEIRNVLYRELPSSYADTDVAVYRQIVFEHVRLTIRRHDKCIFFKMHPISNTP